jgi:hypothetical protein
MELFSDERYLGDVGVFLVNLFCEIDSGKKMSVTSLFENDFSNKDYYYNLVSMAPYDGKFNLIDWSRAMDTWIWNKKSVKLRCGYEVTFRCRKLSHMGIISYYRDVVNGVSQIILLKKLPQELVDKILEFSTRYWEYESIAYTSR